MTMTDPIDRATLSITLGESFIPESKDVIKYVVSAEVEDTLYIPSRCKIKIQNLDDSNHDFKWSESDKFQIGKKIKVKMGRDSDTGGVFNGEITGWDFNADIDGTGDTLTITAFDKSHRLHRGRVTKQYNKAPESKLIQDVAQEAGLIPSIDPQLAAMSPLPNEYVLRENQSAFEFLQERAQRLGFEFYVQDGKLVFQKTPLLDPLPPTLTYRDDLREFRVRLVTAEQVGKVTVRGWDEKKKEAIVGVATRGMDASKIGLMKSGAQASSDFGDREIELLDYTVVNQSQAKSLAQSYLDKISNEFITAEGLCRGNPDIRAGKRVMIKGVGTKFNGQYYISSAKHVILRGEYKTYFTASGRTPDTLLSLLNRDEQTTNGHKKLGQGVVTGIVSDINDLENMGRVKVTFPWMPSKTGPDVESTWARVASPFAGKDRGFFWLPEVGDEVLVAFERGDLDRPYIIGGLWNGKDTPPADTKTAVATGGESKVKQRIIKTTKGHTITIDDSLDTPGITIEDKDKRNKILIKSDAKFQTTIFSGDEKSQITQQIVLDGANKKIDVLSKGGAGNLQFTMDAKGNKISFNAGTGDIEIKGKNITIESQMKTAIDSKAFEIKGAGPSSIDAGSGILEVKGQKILLN